MTPQARVLGCTQTRLEMYRQGLTGSLAFPPSVYLASEALGLLENILNYHERLGEGRKAWLRALKPIFLMRSRRKEVVLTDSRLVVQSISYLVHLKPRG